VTGFYPSGITTDGGYLHVTEATTIRKIEKGTGAVTTLAGSAGIYGSADGPRTTASFYTPFSATTDGLSLYVSDQGNNTIRKIQ